MAGTFDLELASGDLKVTSGDFSLIDGAYQVAQAVEIRLKALRGEWFLDQTFGVAYFDGILGKKMVNKSEIDSVVKAEILKVDGVNIILAFESSFDRAPRIYNVSFTADTIYGPVQYTGVLP